MCPSISPIFGPHGAIFVVTDNSNIGPTDFNQHCIKAPVDSRLPDVGGYQVCGLYNITEAAFARPTSNLVSNAAKFETNRTV